MNRQIAILIIIVTGILGTISASAQRKPYTQLMKEIGPTFASLKKDLDSNMADAAAQDAVKLEGLFKETEEFWAQFNTKDAVDYAKNAQKAFSEIGAKAKSNDIPGAQKAYGTIGSICGDCHFSHREDTGKGFVIKP
jgi:cytochrome c556